MRAYEEDFAGWTEDTARAISEGRWQDIDCAALIDEVESLGKRDRREVASRLEILLLHLLKNEYQPERRSRSWQSSTLTQRAKLQTLLGESPSLATPAEMEEAIRKAYAFARRKAAAETGIELGTFPEMCQWTLDQIMRGDAGLEG